ncbi:MAG: Stp1/IreP family PP2C-type Ser/Thr phosphatase [Chloroflexia bacterium]|nr:Stp1/IreP family PP2C-type Ser/Thr phosphatase [Chloroflexia bacterium]
MSSEFLAQILCPGCDGLNRSGARFCRHCGTLLEGATLVEEAREIIGTPEQIMQGFRFQERLAADLILPGGWLNLDRCQELLAARLECWQIVLRNTPSMQPLAQRAVLIFDKALAHVRDLQHNHPDGRVPLPSSAGSWPLRLPQYACSHCGQGNRLEARFCQKCGALLDRERDAPPVLGLPTQWGLGTDKGRVRRHNEDSVYGQLLECRDGRKAFLGLVADGMGGHQAGEVASQIARDTISQYVREKLCLEPPLQAAQLLEEAVQEANRVVHRDAQLDPGRKGMGTTVVAALIHQGQAHIAWVGDSRAYLIDEAGLVNGQNIALLTNDHTLVARLADLGVIRPDEARQHPQRSVLYRSVGAAQVVEVDMRVQTLQAGDLLLLCSDGLSTYVPDEEMARIILESAETQSACRALVQAANAAGGGDNISVVLVECQPM